MLRALAPVMCLLSVACSSGDGDEKTKVNQANPCATPGATYLQTTTTIDGTCPDLPTQVVNIGNDGTIGGAGIECEKVEQDGCRAHDTNCVAKTEKCMATSTFTTTFEQDGSSASGLVTMTIECTDGSSCIGTYETKLVRQ